VLNLKPHDLKSIKRTRLSEQVVFLGERNVATAKNEVSFAEGQLKLAQEDEKNASENLQRLIELEDQLKTALKKTKA
jgi:hypothetical protein